MWFIKGNRVYPVALNAFFIIIFTFAKVIMAVKRLYFLLKCTIFAKILSIFEIE